MLETTFELDRHARYGWFVPGAGNKPCRDTSGVVVPIQTHSLNVAEVIDPDAVFHDTDALVTRLRGVEVGIRTADCIPVLFYAPDIQAVGAAHAGWKGTLGGIVRNTVGVLVGMGADAGRMTVRFGPGICTDCFEVGDEIAEKFYDAGFGDYVMKGNFIDRLGSRTFNPEKWHIDLIGVNMHILAETGIMPSRIAVSGLCTRHDTFKDKEGETCRLPSWRRENGTQLRMLSWIGLSATDY